MLRPRLYGILVTFSIVMSAGGCGDSSTPGEAAKSMSLYVDPANSDFSQNPDLLDRIRSGPHGYFRFINIPFSNEVCQRFSAMLRGTPSFNLHGDAHIEQYAVTDLGRGLTDFDDSSTGPAVIDIMRFGVSLHLACRAFGWSDQAENLIDKFLSGYRAALRDPNMEAPEPVLVKRLRQSFKYDRAKYFEWVTSIRDEMPAEEQDGVRQAMAPYIDGMYSEYTDLPKSYFDVVDLGYLRMGIGSALDLKYLVRVKGMSEDPMDDVVLEVKQVRDLTGIECITTTQADDPFRILIGQARIAYDPYRYLGYIRFKGLTFWVHAWVDNYREFEIGKTAQSVAELAEVAYDIGVQLGRGHTNQIAAPLDQQLRREQLRLLTKTESQMKIACRALAQETVLAWQAFCSNLDQHN